MEDGPGEDMARRRIGTRKWLSRLSQIPYKEVKREKIKLPQRQDKAAYVRPPLHDQNFVPQAD